MTRRRAISGKHGIAFEDLLLVFNDMFALDAVDIDAEYGEPE